MAGSQKQVAGLNAGIAVHGSSFSGGLERTLPIAGTGWPTRMVTRERCKACSFGKIRLLIAGDGEKLTISQEEVHGRNGVAAQVERDESRLSKNAFCVVRKQKGGHYISWKSAAAK